MPTAPSSNTRGSPSPNLPRAFPFASPVIKALPPTKLESEICALALDDLQRKFVIGDTNGNIKVFNYLNGAVLDTIRCVFLSFFFLVCPMACTFLRPALG